MPETKLESRTPRAADTAQPQPKSHGLALKDRRHLAVTGVIRVVSCDENAAVLETPLGNLTVGGQELQIGELSTQSGQVQLSGKIEYLQYAENQQSGGRLLARLFRSMAPSPAPWAVLGDVLWCLGLGCLLGAARDAVRLALGEGPVRCFFRDIAVFAAAAVLVCGFAAGASAGGLARWYMSAAVLLGAVSWRWAVQPAVHRAAAALAELAYRPLRLVHKMLVRPAQMRLQAAKSRRRACRKAKKSAKIKKSAEKRLQKPSKVLYN